LFILLISVKLLFEETDFPLLDSSRIFISKATIDGASVGNRVSLFYQICVFVLAVFPLLLILSKRFVRRYSKASSGLIYLASSGVILLMADAMGYESGQATKSIAILLGFFCLLHGFRAPKSTVKVFPTVILVAFISSSILLFFFNSSRVVTAQFETIFLLLVVVVMATHYAFTVKLNFLSREFFGILIPLSLNPLLIFVSVESHFLFEDGTSLLSYKKVFVILFLILGVIWLFLQKKYRLNVNTISGRFFAPAALVTFLLLVFYKPLIEQPTASYLLFELANPANAQLNIFQFGELPFVDFMTSHMFSEQFYGIIYHLIYGYDGNLDFQVYTFLYFIVLFLLAFAFGKKLFQSWIPALLLVVLFPFFDQIFPRDLFYSVVGFGACLYAVKNSTVKSYVLLLAALIALVVWRLETGVATLFTAAFFIPSMYYVERRFPQPRVLLKATGIVSLIVIFLLIIASSIRSLDHVFGNFLTAYHYISANQAHGYSEIATGFDHHLYVILFLLPLVALMAVVFGVKRLSHMVSKEQQFTMKGAIFFFLIFLTNFPRGLVRHGFLENQDRYYTATFFLALALFILSLARIRSVPSRYVVFCCSAFLSLLSVKYIALPKGDAPIESYFSNSTLVDLDRQLTAANERVVGYEMFMDGYSEFCDFVDANLAEQQTFLDFSNEPMLYYYTGRRVPSYFAQSLQNTIDDYTQFNMLSRVDTAMVPMVVYSHDPPNWFDATDGVPNAMRQYLIADYIYRYYRPFEVISGFRVWMLKSHLSGAYAPYDDALLNQSYDYGNSAWVIYKHFDERGEDLEKIYEQQFEDQYVKLSSEVVGQPSHFMSITLNEGVSSQVVTCKLIDAGKEVGSVSIETNEKCRNYMIPISNHLSWHELSPDSIRFESQLLDKMKSIAFYKDLRSAN
jgi:hypothetical protein